MNINYRLIKLMILSLSISIFINNSAMSATGAETASVLNARFSNIVEDCSGEAAYTCSGIVLRSNEGKDYTWTISQNSLEKEKFSTSFIRNDITDGANSVFRNHKIGFGIILFSPNEKNIIHDAYFLSTD